MIEHEMLYGKSREYLVQKIRSLERAIGVKNFTIENLQEAVRISRENNENRIETIEELRATIKRLGERIKLLERVG